MAEQARGAAGADTPTVTDMQVIPVAGQDSMLLNLCGAHGPFFTRNLVVLRDNAGRTGVGEVPGGEGIRQTLERTRPLVVGRRLGLYNAILNDVRRAVAGTGEATRRSTAHQVTSEAEAAVLRQPHEINLRADNVLTAVEAALLDLLGQFLGVPVAALLGGGQRRDSVKVLAYLFYVGDRARTDLAYPSDPRAADGWLRLRDEAALTPDGIARQAEAAAARYGFADFKLKGGVMRGAAEMEAVSAIKKRFPDARVTLDPNGAWSLAEAIALCKGRGDVLAYAEDPCGPRTATPAAKPWPSSARDRTAHRDQHGGHGLAADGALRAAAGRGHPAGRPALLDHAGSVRLAQLCDEWGLTWGSHSNNHFDVSLAMFTTAPPPAPGNITAIDTHWIWQEGRERLTKEPLRIVGGAVEVPQGPASGSRSTWTRCWRRTSCTRRSGGTARDDAMAMQYLVPGWKYDPKKAEPGRRPGLTAAPSTAEKRRKTLPSVPRRTAATAMLALVSPPAYAQGGAYPTQPVRVIVPFSAGTSDTVARLVGTEMGKALGQPVVVDNRPGAGGNLGSEACARARPDGHTICLGTISSHAINPSIYPRIPYDNLRDFAPITQLASQPNALAVSQDFRPARSRIWWRT
jgi:glucarate dehydratase